MQTLRVLQLSGVDVVVGGLVVVGVMVLMVQAPPWSPFALARAASATSVEILVIILLLVSIWC